MAHDNQDGDSMSTPIYRGVFPVAPTIFDENGKLDLEGQKRAIDFMIDAGSNGICILANFGAVRALRRRARAGAGHGLEARGRPHPRDRHHHPLRQPDLCRAQPRAQDAGAAMVMVMPPYHGATFRVSEKQIYEFFGRVSDAIDIPIMIQDAPVAGTPLSAPFLAAWPRRSRTSPTSRSRPPVPPPSCAN
jgi:4-hydroxy-tetrahydrodipicolinate synthase